MITFLTGVMSSGKTHRLLLEIGEYEQCSLPYLVIKPKVDTRNGSKVVSRATSVTHDAFMVDERNKEEVKVLFDSLNNYSCLFIDEVQFFTATFVDRILERAHHVECDVLASGLTYDFLHNKFPSSALLHVVGTVVELVEPCEICDLDDALYNVRVDSNGHLVEQGGQVGVEGEHTYKSVCCGCKEGLRA